MKLSAYTKTKKTSTQGRVSMREKRWIEGDNMNFKQRTEVSITYDSTGVLELVVNN